MNAIDDNDLILYHWRDGLDDVRIAEIDAALAMSPRLRARYDTLLALLAQADDVPALQPAADFERRLWQRLSARIGIPPSRVAVKSWSERARSWWRVAPPLQWIGASAFAVVGAIAVGFLAGRQSVPIGDGASPMRANATATRMLDAYVAEHLRTTEGLLMTAVNADDGALADDRKLASALVDSNRLYALAATHAGNARLADFLRQLEPVLIELANPPASASIQSVEGLRDYVRRTDLLFEVRATEARIDPLGKRGL